jgi:hypothetical protein
MMTDAPRVVYDAAQEANRKDGIRKTVKEYILDRFVYIRAARRCG